MERDLAGNLSLEPAEQEPATQCWIDPNLVPFRGTPIVMGGLEWVVPSLSVRQFREHYQELLATRDVSDDKVLEAMAAELPILLLAMRRNYPKMTQDLLEDLIDLHTFREVVKAVSAQSGVRKAGAPGE